MHQRFRLGEAAVVALALLLAVPRPAAADPLDRRLDRLVAGHDVGVAIAAGGRLIYAHDAHRARPPASNQKLLLTMALFDDLGPGHRMATTLSAARVREGVVRGDLWVEGRGDPTLGRADLRALAGRLRKRGVVRIGGRVMADASYFAPDWDAPGWQSYVQARFMPRPTGLALHPAEPGTSRSPEARVAAILANELRAAGVGVRGHGAGARPDHVRRLARLLSPPLRYLAAKMNSESNNYFAEMLGKRLGASVFGRPGTIEKSARALSRWAAGNGVRVRSHDASGLSYTDRVAPAGMVRLLDATEREPWGPAFRRSLPRPGEGTLSGRLRSVRVRAKTGTHFNGDSALSGWVRLDNGGRATFSILSNAMPKSLEDSIVTVIARSALVPRVAPRPATVGGPARAV